MSYNPTYKWGYIGVTSPTDPNLLLTSWDIHVLHLWVNYEVDSQTNLAEGFVICQRWRLFPSRGIRHSLRRNDLDMSAW